jgi:hypothetical protein
MAALTGGLAHADDPTTSPSPKPSPATTTATVPETPSESTSNPPTSTSDSISTGHSPSSAPTLDLAPRQGSPGDTFTATVTQFVFCDDPRVSFSWDNKTTLGSASTTDGTASANLTVPSDSSGQHLVVAECDGEAILRQPFTVAEPASVLTVTPDSGGLDTQVTATLTNTRNCVAGDHVAGPVQAVTTGLTPQWDGDDLTISRVRLADNRANTQFDFQVPSGSGAGRHTVTVMCGSTELSAPFEVIVPDLTLTPAQGLPGTSVTATATGYGDCHPLSFEWDRGPLNGSIGGAGSTLGFRVPAEAKTGDHEITATCGTYSASAPFKVAVAVEPTLNLHPGHGLPGSTVTASGSGFACREGDVDLRWDGVDSLRAAPAGSFEVSLTVPEAAVGDHRVVASCRTNPEVTSSQAFTVPSETESTAAPPTLTLQPASGHSGDVVRATGDGLTCTTPTGPVRLAWDDGTPLPDAAQGPAGHFESGVLVPEHVGGERLTLRASCPGGVLLAADFTVLAEPPQPQPPTPPSTIPWVLIAVLVVAALGAAKIVRRRRPKQHQPLPDVKAVPREDTSPISSLLEESEPGGETHAIRVETHLGQSSLSVTEGR